MTTKTAVTLGRKLAIAVLAGIKSGENATQDIRDILAAGTPAEIIEAAVYIETRLPVRTVKETRTGKDGKERTMEIDQNAKARNNALSIVRKQLERVSLEVDPAKPLTVKKQDGVWMVLVRAVKPEAAPDETGAESDTDEAVNGKVEALEAAVEAVLANLGTAWVLQALTDGIKAHVAGAGKRSAK